MTAKERYWQSADKEAAGRAWDWAFIEEAALVAHWERLDEAASRNDGRGD